MAKSKFLKSFLYLFAILTFLLSLITTTLAYFKFSTYLYGEGELPILKVYANVENVNSGQALKSIKYSGQTSEVINVSFNTNGNNVAGKLRVTISFVWQGELNNTTYNDDNEQIVAAKPILCDESKFRVENDRYYLIENFEPNQTIDFITGFEFSALPTEYSGKNVSIYMTADLMQTNKEW